MKIKRRLLAYLCIVCMFVSILYVPDAQSVDAAKKMKLNRKTASVNIGDVVKLKVRNAKKTTRVTWKTSKKAIASIIKKKSKGKKAYADVKAVAAGKAKITAVCKTGKTKKKLTCTITVAAASDQQGGQTQNGTTNTGTNTGKATDAPKDTQTKEPGKETTAPDPGKATEEPGPGEPTSAPATDVPATKEPTAAPSKAPTAAPTRTPAAATATPGGLGNDNFPAVTNARATVDLSTYSSVAGNATYDSAKRTISFNDGETGANTQGAFTIPSGININDNDLVTFRVQGYYFGTSNFRFWIGTSVNSGCTPIELTTGTVPSNRAIGDYPEDVNGTKKNMMNLNVDPTTKAFDVTFTFKAGVSQNDSNSNYSNLTIKYVMDENENGYIDGLIINHIYVVPTGGQVSGPTPTPGQATQAPAGMSGQIDLSQVTGDKASYATYNASTGKLFLNDTSDNTTTIWFPLPSNISSGERVTIAFKGSCDSTCNGFRVWIGDGINSNVSTPEMFNNLSAGTIERTFDLIASNDCNMLTIKSTSYNGGPVRGLTIDSITIFYPDRGPTPLPTEPPTPRPTRLPTAAPTEGPNAEPTPLVNPFTVVDEQKAAVMMYIDPSDSEYDGISHAADGFKADIARVIGVGTDKEGVANSSANGLQVVTNSSQLSGKAIIAGTIGTNGNSVIKSLVSSGKLDVSDIRGKWECYKLQVIKNPVAGVDEALVIAGSDKRGTIYGIYHISELIGVSPWVWWADATPEVRSKIQINGAELNMTSKEPSVKYRGIFLNDEAPSLTTWSGSRYGGRNEKFYKQVFELILRLKGNYLWPAMWGDAFSKGGSQSNDRIANARTADEYGVVMGTSHHEPCYRAGNEWGAEYNNYKGSLSDSSANAWNKYNMPGESGYDSRVNTAVENFWNDGIKRNKAYENICTVGMRGENDSSLPAADNPPKYAQLLNYIINRQKTLLSNNGDTNPTQLVVYKEVENAWNQGALYNQACMADTYAMMCDDNWAYIRTLPTYEQSKKVKGLGMYYHFDYVGAPKSYTWVQTTQISRIWDQMSVCYDHDVDDVWIANVGDLKPMELNISYFIDLGYDYEKWGVDGQDKLELYQREWIRQQLGQGSSGLNDAQIAEASQLMSDYLDLETLRKVEHVLYNTANNCSDMFSVDNYSEAQDVLMRCDDIMIRTQELFAQIPDSTKPAFYQLIYYPAMAVPNVLRIQIYAALNQKYKNMNLTAANRYADLCSAALNLDTQLYNQQNINMPNGPENGRKWNGMQSADQKYHIGMTAWNTDSGKNPSTSRVNASGNGVLNVLVEGITGSFNRAYTSGSCSLPAFTNTNKEVYTIELANSGANSYNYTATASADWIVLSKTSGTVNTLDSIQVSIDWSKVTSGVSGNVRIASGNSSVTVNVSAKVTNLSGLTEKTYVMENNYVSIDVANYSAKGDGVGSTFDGSAMNNNMIVIPDNGKYLTSVRTSSSTTTYTNTSDLAGAPYVEYKVYVPEAGTYGIQTQYNPSSNLEYGNTKLRYGIQVDGGNITVNNSIVNNYLAGTWSQGTWATDIEKNSRASNVSNVSLSAGVHTIRYYQCDPNLALIRMLVFKGSLATMYGAPAESYYVGKPDSTFDRLYDKEYTYSLINN